MKKICYIILCCLVVSSCKKNESNSAIQVEQGKESLLVSFYKPASDKGSNLAQVSVGNTAFQFTAIGTSLDQQYLEANSLYFSDAPSKTEWVILLDNSRPAFMYRIDAASREKSPGLYAFEPSSDQGVRVKYYQYDWSKKLGKLKYEAQVNEGQTRSCLQIRLSLPLQVPHLEPLQTKK